MRSRPRTSSLALSLAVSACGPTGPASSESSASTSTSETSASTSASETSASETGASETTSGPLPGGPQDDPEEPLACWELLDDGGTADVWGLSTGELLLATTDGVLRFEGDVFTRLGSGLFGSIWASDLDNGWVVQDDALVRIVDGALEPWPEPLGFPVREISGTSPTDVWAAGPGLAHFDGTSWVGIDLEQTFGPGGASLTPIYEVAAAGQSVYFAGGSAWNGLLMWNGAGAITPPPPDSWDFVTRLSTRDGVRLLTWIRWCDIGCGTAAYEFDGVVWSDATQPYFDDWASQAIDLHGDPSGELWALVGSSSLSSEQHLRAARYRDGVWQRVRVPAADIIYALPDGAVTAGAPYRATNACLFGD